MEYLSGFFARYKFIIKYEALTQTNLIFQQGLSYSKSSGRLLSVDKEILNVDTEDRPYSYTEGSTIQGCNPPNLAEKQGRGNLVQLTFDVTELIESTKLQTPSPFSQTLKVHVPFAIIAAATGQHHLVPSFSAFLTPSRKFL
jgi:hypothetical protein